jgi:two-component system capsular synthesis sensor histidine kinase RcsC
MSHRTSFRALVIDDVPAIRSLLTDLLIHLLHADSVDAAASGSEALALFARNRYDLVTTDLAMPGMTGWEVAEALRAVDPNVRLLMLTGAATPDDLERARQCGFPLLRKPISVMDFKRAVEQLLRSR